jgi:hypothetical protein
MTRPRARAKVGAGRRLGESGDRGHAEQRCGGEMNGTHLKKLLWNRV